MRGEPLKAGWRVALYPEAGEAGGSFHALGGRSRSGEGVDYEYDPDRSSTEAARRARGKVRRYCAANDLNRMGTLTYRGEGNHDPKALRDDLGRFFRRLRSGVGEAFPYVWVPEWHSGGHGLHAHFAVGRFIRRGLIESSWGQGFIHIKLLGDLPVGSTTREEARAAAGYLSKYVSKDMDRSDGLNRYDVAQGFQPAAELIKANSSIDAIAALVHRMRAAPAYVWRSKDQEDWRGPPALWVKWR